MTDWVQVRPFVQAAGDVGGDIQVGEAYAACWTRQLADGPYGAVTRSCFPAEMHGTRYLECDTEYLVYTDVSNPSGSETWSDGRQCPVDGPPTDEGARKAAATATPPDDAEWKTYAPAWAVQR